MECDTVGLFGKFFGNLLVHCHVIPDANEAVSPSSNKEGLPNCHVQGNNGSEMVRTISIFEY